MFVIKDEKLREKQELDERLAFILCEIYSRSDLNGAIGRSTVAIARVHSMCDEIHRVHSRPTPMNVLNAPPDLSFGLSTFKTKRLTPFPSGNEQLSN